MLFPLPRSVQGEQYLNEYNELRAVMRNQYGFPTLNPAKYSMPLGANSPPGCVLYDGA